MYDPMILVIYYYFRLSLRSNRLVTLPPPDYIRQPGTPSKITAYHTIVNTNQQTIGVGYYVILMA